MPNVAERLRERERGERKKNIPSIIPKLFFLIMLTV